MEIETSYGERVVVKFQAGVDLPHSLVGDMRQGNTAIIFYGAPAIALAGLLWCMQHVPKLQISIDIINERLLGFADLL